MLGKQRLQPGHVEFNAPFVVDNTAFRTAIGGHVTDWDDAISTTIAWHRTNRTPPTAAPSAPAATTSPTTANSEAPR